MADITTIADLGTAAGTLVLAVATFSAVRSSNRSARVAERTLLAGLRPLVLPSRQDDPEVKVDFQDGVVMTLRPGTARLVHKDGAILMAMSVRNVGAGLALLNGWDVQVGRIIGREADHRDPATFHMLTRDIYVPNGDVGFWQGTLRDENDPAHGMVRQAITDGEFLTVEVLYADGESARRFITRFALNPVDDEGTYRVSASRLWVLD